MEKDFTIDILINLKRKKKRSLTIGIAFYFQKYNKLPTNKNDFKLDYIITEKGSFIMKILVLGDVMALSGRKAIKKNLY